MISPFGLAFRRSRPESARGSQERRCVIDDAPEQPGCAIGALVETGRAHFFDGLRGGASAGHSARRLLPDGAPSESGD